MRDWLYNFPGPTLKVKNFRYMFEAQRSITSLKRLPFPGSNSKDPQSIMLLYSLWLSLNSPQFNDKHSLFPIHYSKIKRNINQQKPNFLNFKSNPRENFPHNSVPTPATIEFLDP